MALPDPSSKVFQLLQSGAVISSTGTAILLASAGLLYYILPYFQDPHGLRQYPGPWAARFSCLWFARYVLVGQAQTCLMEAHEKYGPFVRIGPNDISICSPEALYEIYSHSSPALKSSFYDAFAPFGAARNVFNTRSRGEHARKRKPMSHTMAAKSLLEVLPLIYSYQRMLVKSWDEICGSATKGEEGRKGDCAWTAEGGKAWFNAMPWFNFIAFDVIGDLAFGAPFGMLTAAKAETPVAQSAEQAMGTFHANPNSKSMQLRTINAVETINDSSSFNSFLACLPVWIRPFVMSFPAFKKKLTSRRALAAMAATAVSKRLNNVEPVSRADFLSKLLDSRDANGQPLSKPELSSEALALLVAGSDTTANSTAAIIYYLAQNPNVQTKLQAALDSALGLPNFSSPLEHTIVEDNLAKLKNCEYLLNVINEGLRLNSTVGFGLPRVVPEGGMTVCGKVFNEGTVLSTPGLALHRMREVWGDDADLFVPERWEREDKAAMQKAFSPFSVGPRACLGRNLAYMELQVFIGTLVHRYEFALESADQKLEVHEGFIRKPTGVYVGVRQRRSKNTST